MVVRISVTLMVLIIDPSVADTVILYSRFGVAVAYEMLRVELFDPPEGSLTEGWLKEEVGALGPEGFEVAASEMVPVARLTLVNVSVDVATTPTWFGPMEKKVGVAWIVKPVAAIMVRIAWLGWMFTIGLPRESRAAPVAPLPSTTRSVTLNFPLAR